MTQQVAIVLVNYNGHQWLQSFLPKLKRHSPPDSVYVIDNASKDASCDYLRLQLPDSRIICLNQNLGYAGAYNTGLARIQATYYALLNTDVCVEQGWLAPLLSLMETYPQVGACQPKIHAYTTSKGLRHFEYAGAAGGYIDGLGYPYCRGRVFSTVEVDRGQYDHTVPCDWASGACLMVRRSAFWQVGGFDTRFFMHMEEIDLCWRLHKAGYSVYCHAGTAVMHVGGGSLPKDHPQKTYLNFRNNLLMLYKNTYWYQFCWIACIRFFMDMATVVYFCTQRHSASAWAILRAYMDVWRVNARKVTPTYPTTQLPRKSLSFPKHHTSIVWQYFFKKKRRYLDIHREHAVPTIPHASSLDS